MSAFVVDDECMTRVVRALCARGEYSPMLPLFDGGATRNADSATRIGRALFKMNIEAVMQRYPDTRTNHDDIPGLVDDQGKSIALELAATFTCNVPLKPLSTDELADAVKAIACLRYQCSEGDVIDTPLFKELVTAQGLVAIAIVEHLPAYVTAPWG